LGAYTRIVIARLNMKPGIPREKSRMSPRNSCRNDTDMKSATSFKDCEGGKNDIRRHGARQEHPRGKGISPRWVKTYLVKFFLPPVLELFRVEDSPFVLVWVGTFANERVLLKRYMGEQTGRQMGMWTNGMTWC
jgi:hypothetical protein